MEKLLKRPDANVVMALLFAIVGIVSLQSAPTDVFPNIDIPVVIVNWQFGGAFPDVMGKRTVNYVERPYNSAINPNPSDVTQVVP